MDHQLHPFYREKCMTLLDCAQLIMQDEQANSGVIDELIAKWQNTLLFMFDPADLEVLFTCRSELAARKKTFATAHEQQVYERYHCKVTRQISAVLENYSVPFSARFN